MHRSKRTAGLGLALLALTGLAARAQDKPPPCAEDPMFAQQDVALGHWEVYNTDKQKTADVVLEKALKDCAIRETWTTVDGHPGNGLGLFMYSRLLKGWGYFWAADTGQTTTMYG